MYLLFVISLICFFLSFLHLLTRPILALFSRASSTEKRLFEDIQLMWSEQSKLSMKDDYTAYVKLERKINTTQAILDNLVKQKMAKTMMLRYGLTYGSQIALTLALVGISYMYRSQPVIVFSDKFDFTPFGMLMRFPTGIRGAVSVPFWVFANSFVFRGLAMCFN